MDTVPARLPLTVGYDAALRVTVCRVLDGRISGWMVKGSTICSPSTLGLSLQ